MLKTMKNPLPHCRLAIASISSMGSGRRQLYGTPGGFCRFQPEKVTQNNINGPNRNRWFTYENSMVIFHGELLYSHNQMVEFLNEFLLVPCNSSKRDKNATRRVSKAKLALSPASMPRCG